MIETLFCNIKFFNPVSILVDDEFIGNYICQDDISDEVQEKYLAKAVYDPYSYFQRVSIVRDVKIRISINP